MLWFRTSILFWIRILDKSFALLKLGACPAVNSLPQEDDGEEGEEDEEGEGEEGEDDEDGEEEEEGEAGEASGEGGAKA